MQGKTVLNKKIGVFFDTEFTTLDLDAAKLISIGLVTDDGREFYAELVDTYNTTMCTEFVVDVVLPLLQGGTYLMKETQLADSIKAWIEALGEREVVLRSDSPRYDWSFITELFDLYGWPSNLRRKCGYVYFRHPRHQRRFDAGLESYWKVLRTLRESIMHWLTRAACGSRGSSLSDGGFESGSACRTMGCG